MRGNSNEVAIRSFVNLFPRKTVSIMGENNNLLIQQEITENMSTVTQQPFAMTNEEQTFNAQQQLRAANNRGNRRRTCQEKKDNQRNTQDWVNQSNRDNNILDIGNSRTSALAQGWNHNVSQEVIDVTQQNNKASSESIETIRENIRNSQESLKRRSSESLTIEEASLRSRSQSLESLGHNDDKLMIDTGTTGVMNEPSRITVSDNILDDYSRHSTHDSMTGEVNINSASNNVEENNRLNVSDKTVNENSENRESVTGEDTTNNVNNKVEPIRNSSNDQSKEEFNYTCEELETSKRSHLESTDSLNESTCDLSSSYRTASMKDPHTAAIDLSNNCRQFYFNHLKSAEAIKQSVRAAKHNRAIKKMEGKPSSSIDNAMDRLRSEMADLMDQDLSLMSQLLKLNDKIEEVKTHVAYRHHQELNSSQGSSYFSNSELSDSEFEEYDDSRLDLSESARNLDLSQSARDFKTQTHVEAEPVKEVVLRRMESADSRIIVYKKKKTRKTKRRAKKCQSQLETEDDTSDECDDTDDTESTLSYNSGSTINGSNDSDGAVQTSDDNIDSGIQSPKTPEEPKPPVKGGISQNRRFLNFHQKNSNFTKSTLTGLNSMMTMQGHNISLEKYYVPPGLVYLKQEQSDSVFCQFTK